MKRNEFFKKGWLRVFIALLLLATGVLGSCDYITGDLPGDEPAPGLSAQTPSPSATDPPATRTPTPAQPEGTAKPVPEFQPITAEGHPVYSESLPWVPDSPLPWAVIDDIRANLPEYPGEAEYSANATHVDIEIRSERDWDKLGTLPNLTSLSVVLNSYSDQRFNISALSDFPNLTSLSLEGRFEGVMDLSPLSSLTNLTSLELDLHCRWVYDPSLDVSPLATLVNLKSLALDVDTTANMTALSSLTNLTSFSITKDNFGEWSALNTLADLTSLTVIADTLTRMDIPVFVNLTSLTITTDSVYGPRLQSVSAQPALKRLKLNGNFVDITVLGSLTGLVSLDLSGNGIRDISSLGNLKNLVTLNLADNQIADITPLSSLTHLTSLDLRGNDITDISPLASLKALTDLYLSSNTVIDVRPVANLTSLETLWLGLNQVEDISALATLPYLAEVLLDGNPLNDRSVGTIVPLLRENGVRVFFWVQEEHESLLRFILSSQYDDGGYKIVNPYMGLSYGGFSAAITSYGGAYGRLVDALEAEGCDVLKMTTALNERNNQPEPLTIPSSPQDGYIIDYDNGMATYFDNRDIDGWEVFWEKNPESGGYTTISAPVYDPETGIILVYYDTVGGWLAGIGHLVAFRYRDGVFEGIAEVQLWVS